jgi:hypothetical protein
MRKESPFIQSLRAGAALAVNTAATRTETPDLSALRDAETALVAARMKVKAAAKRSGCDMTALFSDSVFIPRSQADTWVDNAYDNGHANGRVLGAKEVGQAMVASLGKPPSSEFAHLGKLPSATEMNTPEYRAKAEMWEASAKLMGSPALAKFDAGARARIALAWSRETGPGEPKDNRKMDQDNWNPSALQIVNSARKAKGLPALTRLESDEGGDTKDPHQKDLPGDVVDTSSDDDATIDENGKLRRRVKKAGDDNEDQGAPKPSSAAADDDFAFRVCNAGQRARGKPQLSKAEFLALNRR